MIEKLKDYHPNEDQIEYDYLINREELKKRWQLMDERDPEYLYSLWCEKCKKFRKHKRSGVQFGTLEWDYEDLHYEEQAYRKQYSCCKCGEPRVYGVLEGKDDKI